MSRRLTPKYYKPKRKSRKDTEKSGALHSRDNESNGYPLLRRGEKKFKTRIQWKVLSSTERETEILPTQDSLTRKKTAFRMKAK